MKKETIESSNDRISGKISGFVIAVVLSAGALFLVLKERTFSFFAEPRDASLDNSGLISTAAQQGLNPERLKELQLSDRDILGDLELAKKEDPSYESVASYLPAMKRPREVVGVKFHPHDIGVASDGSLELSDDVDVTGSPTAFFEVGSPAVRFGAAPAGCTKILLQGYLPVVVATFDHEGISFRQTIFGYSEALSPDKELWAYVVFEAKNPGKDRRTTEVRLSIKPETKLNLPRSWKLRLDPETSQKIFLKVPFDIQNKKYQQIAEQDFDRCLKQVVEFWSKDLTSGMKLNVPERRVNDACRAWLVFASLDVDKRNGILEPHDGAGFYESVFGYSAALYPHALDLWGRHEEARHCLESLLTFQAPDGLFTSNFGTPDPGTLLLSLWAHYELTGDGEWLRSIAPKMVRMADWIIKKRKESMAREAGRRPVTYGLIKFRPYCDYPEPAFDYFGDTYCAAGIEKTSKVLAAVGLKEEANRIGREAVAYRQDILASMDAAAIERWGIKVLPMEPDTHRLLKSTNYRAGSYYGLVASCMLESEFLPADDRRTGWVIRFLEDKGALRLGMSEFAGGIDHAYTYGYWLNCLKLDRVRPVLLGFYGSLAYGMSRDTYSGVEVTKLFTGDNEPTLPHLYSCTQQLRLLRMMLIREDGANLWIGQAVPRPWFEPTKKVEVQDAPTRFGPVTFSIESQIDRGQISVDLAAPSRETPRNIFLRLRHPQGLKIAGVKVNGKPIKAFTQDTITLDSPRGALRILVIY